MRARARGRRGCGDGLGGHCDLEVSGGQAGGDQGLVGGGADVGAELAEGGFAQHHADALLDPARQAEPFPYRGAVHQRALQLQGVPRSVRAGLDPAQGVVGDQRRGAHRQRGADRAVALQHRAQGQQVVAQALQRGLALAAHLEAADRPGEGAVGVGAGLQRARELGQLVGLVLAQPVAAGAGGAGAGGYPPPAGPRRSGRRRRDQGRCRRP